jgi:hypothetical protein
VRALTLVLAFALAACAQEVAWQKPGASDQDLAQDADGCRSQARAAQGMTADAQRGAVVYESCMEQKGWRRVETSKY